MSHVLHQRRRALAVLAFVVALFASPQVAGAAIKLSDILPKATYPAFYIPPSPLPAGQPGDIIRWQEMSFKKAITKPRRGAKGYLVMYLSTSATGQPIAVTGTVLVPKELPKGGVENRPIIGYGNEAQGLGDNCAVSRLLRFGHTGELALTDPLLYRGYAVASTDYEGLGTPAVHTFGVTNSSSRSVLDMVRAAQRLEVAQLPENGPVGLFGYSQGGAAVGGAAEIAPTYAPELNIKGAALGGAPIEPATFSRKNDGKLFASVNIAASAGYDAAYSELDIKSFLNEAGLEANAATYNSCIEAIFTYANKKTASYLKPGKDPLTDPVWMQRFDENTLGHVAPKIPTYMFHAVYDQAVPYRMATRLRRNWCGGGTPLRFEGLYLFEHVSAGPLWMPQAAKWLQRQLEGTPDKGNCGYTPEIKAKEDAAAKAGV